MIEKRWADVRRRIAAAADRSGRKAEEIRLVAVGKGQGVEALAPLAAAGQIDFGENWMQEAQGKIPRLPRHLRWHFLGHLQRNKVKSLLAFFSLLHSLDSLPLAEEISKRAAPQAPFPCLVEVNLGGEEQKSGLPEEALPAFFTELQRLPGVIVRGLMAIPPYAADPEQTRPYFRRLAELRRRFGARALPANVRLTELSMGMSNDFEVAVEEGATLVRVGTALFGPRGA